jgi:protein O-GlcNAc transferase
MKSTDGNARAAKTSEEHKVITHPIVVVCIPVYNEQRYIEQTLQSVQNQSLSNFICVIRDNASTDATESICRRYAHKDSRFFYIRADFNQGAAQNWEELMHITDSEFIMWLGAHDTIEKAFLEETLNILQTDKSIVLAYSRVKWIDEDGRLIQLTNGGDFVVDNQDPLNRYITTATNIRGECTAINGLIRRSAIQAVPRIRIWTGPDHYVLTKLQWFGRFARVEKELYNRRFFAHREQESYERLTAIKPERPKSRNMWPLVLYQLHDFLTLPVKPGRKIRKLVPFAFGLLWLYKHELPGLKFINKLCIILSRK